MEKRQASIRSFLKMEPSWQPVCKQHFSSIVSWIEDEECMASISRFSDPKTREDDSSHGKSYLSRNLHAMHISARLIEEFMELAKENTSSNLETCGILGATMKDGTYYVTTLVVPKQETTAHSCQASNEEEIHAILEEQSLVPGGWIHIGILTNKMAAETKVMLPEAAAIVIAPTDQTRNYGIFRLTDPGGMDVLRRCRESGNHQHSETLDGRSIYESCNHVYFNSNMRFEIIDLRSS